MTRDKAWQDVISALSPNGRWYGGTVGSYKAARSLGIKRSAVPKFLSVAWNAVAWKWSTDDTSRAIYGQIVVASLSRMTEHERTVFRRLCDAHGADLSQVTR